MPDAFYTRDRDRLLPQPWCIGPWDPRTQHGGPPSALLASAMIQHPAARGYRLARLTVDFLRPVPMEPLSIEVAVERAGRTAARLAATLHAGRPVLRAAGLMLREADSPAPQPEPEPWPAPSDCQPCAFPFFRWAPAYHQAVELLPTPPERWGGPSLRLWGRPRFPLVLGEETLPEARVVILADAESGMAPPLDPDRWSFANPDLSVVFARRPEAGWLGFDVRSYAGDSGAGLSEAALRDARGAFGRSVQTLVVGPR